MSLSKESANNILTDSQSNYKPKQFEQESKVVIVLELRTRVCIVSMHGHLIGDTNIQW